MNIVVNNSCLLVLLYAKMLKEIKTKETIVFFVTFLSLVAFQLGGGAGSLPPPPPTPWLHLFCGEVAINDYLHPQSRTCPKQSCRLYFFSGCCYTQFRVRFFLSSVLFFRCYEPLSELLQHYN